MQVFLSKAKSGPCAGRHVAVKSGGSSFGARDFLANEAYVCCTLGLHPRIMSILDIIDDVTCPQHPVDGLVMPLYAGGSLQALVDRMRAAHPDHPPLDMLWVVNMFHDCIIGLRHMHQCGLVHSDLKPDNILLDGSARPVLADFGLSSREGTVQVARGTLAFMAPEVRPLLLCGATCSCTCWLHSVCLHHVVASGFQLCHSMLGFSGDSLSCRYNST
jgi:serine/threonine protein kinase